MILVNFGLKQPAGTVYRGRPAAGGHYKNGKLKRPIVTVNGKRLDPRLDLGEMSPTGFHWGYGGAGPSQLALAVLAHAAGDQVAMEEWYRFRQEVIKQLDMHPGATHEGLRSYTQTCAEKTAACKASVFPVDAQAGGVNFRLELGRNGSHA